ncbi:MAG TPA: class I SAM-dependent methyltransferase [Chitinophagaceae bacterium]|nr:class I SAM-dependent methyltransferase [Chitinophagaceae bacterium]
MAIPFTGKFEMFRNRLEKVYKHRSKLARRQQISCYRLYDRDLPEFPLIIEIYGPGVYVAEYRSSHKLNIEEYDEWLNGSLQSISEVLQVNPDLVFCKMRERKLGRQGQYLKTGSSKQEYVVDEGGLKFIVNLSDYLDTGLFLDHRITRSMVKNGSPGKKVLNLFCYTGSFTVYAAAGGAVETVSIDLSNTYLDWTRRNMELNGFNSPQNKLIKGDVLQLLPGLPDDHFDIVVLDPPTFSNSKMMKEFLDIQRDHVELINLCLQKTVTGGVVYFSTNLRNFHLEKELLKASLVTDITKSTTPFDFEGKLLRWCFKIVR